jgi:hypothetical protein
MTTQTHVEKTKNNMIPGDKIIGTKRGGPYNNGGYYTVIRHDEGDNKIVLQESTRDQPHYEIYSDTIYLVEEKASDTERLEILPRHMLTDDIVYGPIERPWNTASRITGISDDGNWVEWVDVDDGESGCIDRNRNNKYIVERPKKPGSTVVQAQDIKLGDIIRAWGKRCEVRTIEQLEGNLADIRMLLDYTEEAGNTWITWNREDEVDLIFRTGIEQKVENHSLNTKERIAGDIDEGQKILHEDKEWTVQSTTRDFTGNYIFLVLKAEDGLERPASFLKECPIPVIDWEEELTHRDYVLLRCSLALRLDNPEATDSTKVRGELSQLKAKLTRMDRTGLQQR